MVHRMPKRTVLGRSETRELTTFGCITVCILLAEALLGLKYGRLGSLVYTTLVFALLLAVQRSDEPASHLYQSLLLIPVLRLVDISIPSMIDSPLASIVGIYLPFLASALIIVRSQNLSLETLGLTGRDARLVLPGLLVGLGFGFAHSTVALRGLSSVETLQLPLSLLLVVSLLGAFVGELVFRGLIQRWAGVVFDDWFAILMVSVLFGASYVVWFEPVSLVVGGVIALLLGYAYHRTGNLWFVISIHAAINVWILLIAPRALS